MDTRYKGGGLAAEVEDQPDLLSCGVRIGSRRAAVAYVQSLPPRFAGSLLALFLDRDFSLLALDQLGRQNAGQCGLDPVNLAKRAAGVGAIGLVLVHYAPERMSRGSREEYEITKDVRRVAESFDIVLLDHLILAGGKLFDISL